MIWVIDASVAVRWLLKGEEHALADAVLREVVDNPSLFAVPELFCYEVYAVLCRLHPSPREAYLRGISPILNGGIWRSPMTDELVRDAIPFVLKGLTGYDACYAALATHMKGIWITLDEKAHRQIARTGISHLLKKKLPDDWP